ncbi:MAG TPA: hypothetical protein VF765_11470 [Polyangiaceae bacterium]
MVRPRPSLSRVAAICALWLAASCGQSSSGSGGEQEGGAGSSSGGIAGSSSGGSSGSSSGGSSGGSSGSSSSSGGSSGGSSGSSSGATDGSTTDGPAGGSCAKASAACTCSNNGCNVGSYYLYDNQWNCGSGSGNNCGPESAYGCSNADGTVSWVVTSNQPAGNTAVLTYPAMQDNFNKPALSSFTTISASFSETSPHVGDYEVAWDCWFNSNANELMIWVDNYNQTPGGSKVASGVALGGRTYDVWWGPSMGTGGYVVFYANTTVTSGTFDLLGIFQYAASHGWLPTTSTVDQISFGVEVCSTGGQDATWTVDGYSVTAK